LNILHSITDSIIMLYIAVFVCVREILLSVLYPVISIINKKLIEAGVVGQF